MERDGHIDHDPQDVPADDGKDGIRARDVSDTDAAQLPPDADLDAALFSAFDSMKAPEALMSRTLDAMKAAASEQWDETAQTVAATRGEEPIPLAAEAARRAAVSDASSSTSNAGRSTDSQHKRNTAAIRKIFSIAVAACLAFAVLGGGVAYGTETACVSVESAASVELGVNRFGITIRATADNPEGETLLAQGDVRNKPYRESVQILVDNAKACGYIGSDNDILVTVSSNDAIQRTSMDGQTEGVLADLGYDVTYFSTDLTVRQYARDAGMTTGRYETYLMLREEGVDVTPAECTTRSIAELKAALEKTPGLPEGDRGNGAATTQNPDTGQQGYVPDVGVLPTGGALSTGPTSPDGPSVPSGDAPTLGAANPGGGAPSSGTGGGQGSGLNPPQGDNGSTSSQSSDNR